MTSRGYKIYGIMPVYNEEVWIEYAIEQALNIVDYLVILEGFQGPPWKGFSMRSTDRTREIVDRYKDHPNVVVKNCAWSLTVDLGKARTHKKALRWYRKLGIQENDWIWLLDADEFYTNEQVTSIKTYLAETDCDLVKVHDRMFIYNYCYYIPAEHKRLYRYTEGMRFHRYGQHPKYASGEKYVDYPKKIGTTLEDNPMFHYSFVRTNEHEKKRREFEWKSGFRKKDIMDWYEQVYLQRNENNAEEIYFKNKELTGGTGWFYKDDRRIEKYKGHHPSNLKNHPYRNIADMRDIN